MTTFTIDGKTITYNGELAEKLRILDLMGISYTPTAEELQDEVDIQALKDAYLSMITRLEQIQSASNPTNAQIVQAIKDEALYIERIMKFLKRLLT